MRYAFLLLALGMLLITERSAMAFQDESQNQVRLVLATTVTNSRNVRVTVKIQNQTDQAIQVNIPDRNPPVDLSIWDDSGRDLYQYVSANLRKDGKSIDPNRRHKNITLDLGPREAKEYSWTVSKVSIDNKLVSIPAGQYKFQARLATVTVNAGAYRTRLHQSNEVEVVIPK